MALLLLLTPSYLEETTVPVTLQASLRAWRRRSDQEQIETCLDYLEAHPYQPPAFRRA
jgi:hypothetical protein